MAISALITKTLFFSYHLNMGIVLLITDFRHFDPNNQTSELNKINNVAKFSKRTCILWKFCFLSTFATSWLIIFLENFRKILISSEDWRLKTWEGIIEINKFMRGVHILRSPWSRVHWARISYAEINFFVLFVEEKA